MQIFGDTGQSLYRFCCSCLVCVNACPCLGSNSGSWGVGAQSAFHSGWKDVAEQCQIFSHACLGTATFCMITCGFLCLWWWQLGWSWKIRWASVVSLCSGNTGYCRKSVSTRLQWSEILSAVPSFSSSCVGSGMGLHENLRTTDFNTCRNQHVLRHWVISLHFFRNEF